MINLRNVSYRVVVVTEGGTQLDITETVTNLGWEEGGRELSARISLKLHNAIYQRKYLSDIVQPMTPIFVYATIDKTTEEVIRGTVSMWSPTEDNGNQFVDITAYDEMIALRRNQDDRYYSDGTGTKAIITSLLDDWGVPYEYQGPDLSHGKLVFRKRYLSDIVLSVLDDVKKHGGGSYFARAKEGIVQIIARGSNETIYHFDIEDNVTDIRDSFQADSIVTRVKIVGKTIDDGHPSVEAVKDGRTEFGIRQVILERQNDKNLADAEKTAEEILKECGRIKRRTSIIAPDLPTLRKGDKIRLRSGLEQGYFYVKAVRHNATDGKMNVELDTLHEDSTGDISISDEYSE